MPDSTTADSGDNPTVDDATIRVLMVGDVIGRPGRTAFADIVPGLRRDLAIDLVVVNGENSASGRGISLQTARALRSGGADVITTGNHVWAHPEIDDVLKDKHLRVIRPANYGENLPGKGWVTVSVRHHEVTIINLIGRVFMNPVDDPFRTVDGLLSSQMGYPARANVIVDFHAEATSEKVAMGWHLDGRVSAVVGTHTHIATADARMLSKSTAYVTDLGMVGPRDSVIGSEIEASLGRFTTGRPGRQSVAEGPIMFNAVLVELDATTGHGRMIRRVDHIDPNSLEVRGRS